MRHVILAALVVASVSAQAESYFCTVTMQAGLNYDKATKQWSSARFTANRQYMVRRPTSEEDKQSGPTKYPWIVVRHGSTNLIPDAVCAKDFDDDVIWCEGLGSEFKFNRKRLRFLTTYEYGYWHWIEGLSKEGDDTPAVGGGMCSKVN